MHYCEPGVTATPRIDFRMLLLKKFPEIDMWKVGSVTIDVGCIPLKRKGDGKKDEPDSIEKPDLEDIWQRLRKALAQLDSCASRGFQSRGRASELAHLGDGTSQPAVHHARYSREQRYPQCPRLHDGHARTKWQCDSCSANLSSRCLLFRRPEHAGCE
jgi:hypothetical protein